MKTNPFDNLPALLPRMEGFKLAADVSIMHITQHDVDVLETHQPPSLIGVYEYGFVVLTHTNPESLAEAGFTGMYIDLLQTLYEKEIYYAFLDTDGEVWPNLKTREASEAA